MTPQSRLNALRMLGVEITPEIEYREYRISLDTIERNYGENWEQDADAVRNFIEAAEAGDKWIAEKTAEHAEGMDNERTMREAAV